MSQLVDYVRQLTAKFRWRLNPAETELARFLRGNAPLHEALKAFLQERLKGRANVPEPSTPDECKSIVARDREVQWVINRLEFLFKSPVSTPADVEGEPPA